MKKLLLGTTNKAKIKEIKKYFSQFFPELQLVTLDGIEIEGEPEETGKTFKENAILKARFYAQRSGLTTLSDDGGLEIQALGNAPGVKSRRWPGYEASDQELVDMVFRKMKEVPLEKRGARLKAVIAVVDCEGEVIVCEQGSIEGIISEQPASWIEENFPYRAVFYLPRFQKFYQDLTFKEHQEINHRKQILKKVSLKLDVQNLYNWTGS